MPRNRSEKLPSSPAAHAYLEACERWFKHGNNSEFSDLWWSLGDLVRRRIISACGSRTNTASETIWRRSVVAFIAENYAP